MIFNSQKVNENRLRLEQLIAQFSVLEFDADAAIDFGRLRAELRKSGTAIPVFDVMIGSIARTQGCTLVSADRHFAGVPGLVVEDWITRREMLDVDEVVRAFPCRNLVLRMWTEQSRRRRRSDGTNVCTLRKCPGGGCRQLGGGTVSPTTFWDTQTGKFAGNARGMAQYLTLNADGTYKQYVYIETRSYNITTRVWTQHEGTVSFNGNSLTLKPTKGHYKSAGSWKIDRDMTEKELAEKTVTYKWRKEKDANGAELLVIPFDDGSAFRLKRAS
jgi:tRNA(fMet)-specific endonuclease VapC